MPTSGLCRVDAANARMRAEARLPIGIIGAIAKVAPELVTLAAEITCVGRSCQIAEVGKTEMFGPVIASISRRLTINPGRSCNTCPRRAQTSGLEQFPSTLATVIVAAWRCLKGRHARYKIS
jgi:hypothetical protein